MSVKKTAKKVAKTAKKVARSDAAKKYIELMAEYEAKNPDKFAFKKDRMEAHLKSL